METKPCSRCSRPASLSFYLLLSTVGIRPRLQQSSKSLLLCSSCMAELIASLADSQPELHSQLSGSFKGLGLELGAGLQADERGRQRD
jgi:hypothetical protein